MDESNTTPIRVEVPINHHDISKAQAHTYCEEVDNDFEEIARETARALADTLTGETAWQLHKSSSIVTKIEVRHYPLEDANRALQERICNHVEEDIKSSLVKPAKPMFLQ